MNIVEILAKVGFDWQVALANLVNFLVIFFILKAFVFKPVQNIITKRKEAIEQGMRDAEEAKERLANAETESDSLVLQAKKDAENIILEAREEGRNVKDRIEEGARVKEVEILRLAEEKAAAAHAKMFEDVQHEAADLVVDTVAQLLKKEMTDKDHTAYIEHAAALIRK